jgi:lysyl oxidase-like protein 2/3/4
MLEAIVVCRQLGFGFANTAIQTDFFGGRTGNQTHIPMILSGVQCTGTEDTLDACLHDQINVVDCPGERENIAAVACTQGMPPCDKHILKKIMCLITGKFQ